MLPRIQDLEGYRAIYAENKPWLPAMRHICNIHGLDPATLQRQELGTHVVFKASQVILKLFCPLWPDDYPAEKAVLEAIKGIPAPEITASGGVEGWPYLVMTAVPGKPLLIVWDQLGKDQQRSIVVQLGQMMRTLHRLPALPQLANDWDAFLGERLANWREHHQPPAHWSGWLEQQLEGFNEPPFEPVLLNGDITADHLLLSEEDGRWVISGLIDFGDAMMGYPYYDFIAPLTFITVGRPQLSRLLLENYGLDVTPERTRRLTSYCFLHRFAHLSDYLARYQVADGPAFHRALWGDS